MARGRVARGDGLPAIRDERRGFGQGGGGGGTTVNNFNSPILTTGGESDKAEAGRLIADIVDTGTNRFGRTS